MNPSQKTLEQYSDSHYYLNISSLNYEVDIINAPVYVAVNQINQTFIGFHYTLLCVYSGGIVFQLDTVSELLSMNGILNTYGHHQGDLERIFVRLYIESNGKLKLHRYGYEQHGIVHFFNPTTKNLYNRTHPININDSNMISLEKQNYYSLKFTVADTISNNGLEWKPFEKIQLIGLYEGLPINEQQWIKFRERIGDERNNTLEFATCLDRQRVNPILWFIMKMFGNLFLKCVNIPVDQLKEINGNGPTGPSDRKLVNTLSYDKNTYSYVILLNKTSSETNEIT
ncbi:unnamed protein product [Rotaria magnacalcarata]|nr:unnamed protein product [Rotaria magnacalcarata]CAF4150865.1 unnamed protein product [Rotaria magnacalcarata]CAF4237438.1 unnamed protein product [Rotaria magnacalcarata]CAF4314990.1 unnamed protein product [Rotaria magnacalcarata]